MTDGGRDAPPGHVERFHRRAQKPVHVITYWQMDSTSTGKTLTCAGYQSSRFGLELRVQYSEGEIVATKEFRGSGAWALMDACAAEARIAIAEHGPADGWRLTVERQRFNK